MRNKKVDYSGSKESHGGLGWVHPSQIRGIFMMILTHAHESFDSRLIKRGVYVTSCWIRAGVGVSDVFLRECGRRGAM